MLTFDRCWQVVKRHILVLLLTSLLVSFLAYILSERMGEKFHSHFSYAILLRDRERTGDYQFDGYYALATADLLSQTVAARVNAPENVAAAHAVAGLTPPEDLRGVRSVVEAKQTSPQAVEVVVWAGSREEAERLARGVQQVAGERAEDFDLVAGDIWTGVQRISARVVATTTFVFVLLFGVNAVLLREAVRDEDSD